MTGTRASALTRSISPLPPRGTLTLVLGQHRADENFDVAVRENSVILLEEDYENIYEGFDPESTESYIMFKLMQKTYFNQSIEFGDFVQDQFREKRPGCKGTGSACAGSDIHARCFNRNGFYF